MNMRSALLVVSVIEPLANVNALKDMRVKLATGQHVLTTAPVTDVARTLRIFHSEALPNNLTPDHSLNRSPIASVMLTRTGMLRRPEVVSVTLSGEMLIAPSACACTATTSWTNATT
jgi:hypothetical protein